MNWFEISDVREKIEQIGSIVEFGQSAKPYTQKILAKRECEILDFRALPPKIGLSSALGQARLLHDLANIELQAMELAVRSLVEFPEANAKFKEELAELALSESQHLKLCLDGLADLGFKWGDFGIHLGLWNLVSESDSLIDRILIVHRYLEGAGLDAGASILKRLSGTGNRKIIKIIEQVVREEIAHVEFGSKWYRQVAQQEQIDPLAHFSSRLKVLIRQAPRKEKIDRDLRLRAGFSLIELNLLELTYNEYLNSEGEKNGHA